MSHLLPILYFGTLILLFISVPTLISLFPAHWLFKKGYKKAAKVLVSSVVIYLSYLSFTMFYPTDGYFEEIFESYSGLDFPESGQFLSKTTTPPGIPGGYQDKATFTTSREDYEKVFHLIQSNSSFEKFNRSVVKEINDGQSCFSLEKIEKDYQFHLCFKKNKNEILLFKDWDS
jgi:hypothetical protein